MLCSILRAAHIQATPKPLPKASEIVQDSIANPFKEQQPGSNSPTDFPVPEVSSSPPSMSPTSTEQQTSPDSEPTWLITQDLDEHIDSFLNTVDRAKFSELNSNFHRVAELFCRQRLHPEYQFDPHPLRTFGHPAKRQEKFLAIDRTGKRYLSEILRGSNILVHKVSDGQCTLVEALQILYTNTIKLDNFRTSADAHREALIKVNWLSDFIQCGYLELDECIHISQVAYEALTRSPTIRSFVNNKQLDKEHLLNLTVEQWELLTTAHMAEFINRGNVSADQVPDLDGRELDKIIDKALWKSWACETPELEIDSIEPVIETQACHTCDSKLNTNS